MKRMITEEKILQYQEYLYEEEKTIVTIKKYVCDLKKLLDYVGEKELTKKIMVQYKEMLREEKGYKLTSINSFLVAANRFFEFMGWYDLRVKTYRIQKEVFVPENRDLSKAEYKKLVRAAMKKGKRRLAMILQTICATGIRISELSCVTVESVITGIVEIYCKGKQRLVLLPKKLQKKLLHYIQEKGVMSGILFCTSSGRPVDRSNIWKEMKALSQEAEITEQKVYPHNLRHLFAKEFYAVEKDIAKLADILGHSSMETTRIYIKTTSEEHQKQLNMMRLVV